VQNTLSVMDFSLVLGILLVSALIAVLALAITLGVDRANDRGSSTDTGTMEETSDDICLTPECVELSNQISQSLDMSVDPCEDFYHFGCKGFTEEAIIPQGSEWVVSAF